MKEAGARALASANSLATLAKTASINAEAIEFYSEVVVQRQLWRD